MKLERKVYTTRKEKAIDFVLGFFGWFLVNGLLYGCSILILQAVDSSTSDSILALLLGLLPLLVNIAALIFFVLRLLKRLQGMATAPAIVYDDYGSVLGGGERSDG